MGLCAGEGQGCEELNRTWETPELKREVEEHTKHLPQEYPGVRGCAGMISRPSQVCYQPALGGNHQLLVGL